MIRSDEAQGEHLAKRKSWHPAIRDGPGLLKECTGTLGGEKATQQYLALSVRVETTNQEAVFT